MIEVKQKFGKGDDLILTMIEVGRGRQDVRLTALGCLAASEGPVRLRFRIRGDAYVEQSEAVAEAWDGSQWREVYRLLPENMQVAGNKALIYGRVGTGPGLTPDSFAEDLGRLIAAVREVLQ